MTAATRASVELGKKTRDGRVRKAWRMPVGLVECLYSEAQASEIDLTLLVTRALRGLDSFYELDTTAVADLERDRRALTMSRWDYLLHGLASRARQVAKRGPGFDAPVTPHSGAGPLSTLVARFEGGATRFMNFYLHPAVITAVREGAASQGWRSDTVMATALLKLFAGFDPLPMAPAFELERDRVSSGLDRWNYLRHLWWRRAERVASEGPGFDRPDPRT